MEFDSRQSPNYSPPVGVSQGWTAARAASSRGSRFRGREGALGGVLAGCLLAGAVTYAQTGGEETAPRGPAEPSLELGFVDASQVSLTDKRNRTEQMLAEERGSLVRGTELLQEARAAKDIVQLNCVNEKLTQIKGLLKLSEQASVKMYEAIAAYTEDVINHEFTKIWVAHQKTMLLKSEAEQCVGELSVYAGDTEVEVIIDDAIGEDDPTEQDPPVPGPAVPPVASGF